METLKVVFDFAQFVGTITAIVFGIRAIKQNSRSTRASAASQLYTLADSLFTLRIDNPTVVAQLGEEYDALLAANPAMHDRCLCLVRVAFNLYEQAFYFCKRYEIFAEHDWEPWAAELEALWLNHSFAKGAWQAVRDNYSAAYRNAVDTLT